MEGLTYGSVCSGIEAASTAWEPLGFLPAWFSEIEPFPSEVLSHHWPRVANLGDMTTIADRVRGGEVSAPDVLVGGTPCQAFSVAGSGYLQPVICMAHGQGGAEIAENRSPTLTCNHEAPIAVYAFQPRIGRNGRGDMGELVGALTAQAGATGKGDAAPCVAYSIRTANTSSNGWGIQEDVTHTLDTAQGLAVGCGSAVRRLTPLECERLQGFPDNHTLIPAAKRRKLEADELEYIRFHFPDMPDDEARKLAADGSRYKALGNSMAVPCMAFIGMRLQAEIEKSAL